MSDLWAEASRDVEAEQRELAYRRASAALEPLWPFLAVSQSQAELEHRKALAMGSLQTVARNSGMALDELGEMIDRRFALLAEAAKACPCGNSNCQCSGDCNCQPGCVCGRCHVASEVTASLTKQAEEEEGRVQVVDKRTGAAVAGPFSREQAEEFLKDNDSGLPASELAIEPVDEEPEEGEEKEASLRHALNEGENILAETVPQVGGTGQPEKPVEHDEGPDESIPADARNRMPEAVAARSVTELAREARRLVRLATEGQPPVPDMPPAKGETPPEGPDAPGEMSSPPAAQVQAETTKPRQMPGGGGGSESMTDVMAGDPVGDKVDQVTATVRKHNPHLSETLCRRVARKAVAKQLSAGLDEDLNYYPGQHHPDEEEKDGGSHSGEVAAGGIARKVVDKLPLLEI